MNPSKNDLVILKSTNNPGFVCNQGKFVYFNKMVGDKFECSIRPNSQKIILISKHQINTIIDVITNLVIYQHHPSDGL